MSAPTLEATDEPAAAGVVFKKPSRRGNVRKRERTDDEAAAAEDEGASGASTSLEMMRELQKQRQRAKGVTLEARGVGDEVDEALAAGGETTEHGLESTFTSVVDLAKEHFRWLPIGRVLEHRFMTRDFAKRLSCPLLVAHGAADSIIDVHHGKELARLFHADEYIEVARIDHNDMLLVGLIATRYLNFLEGAVPAGQQ